MAKMNMIQALNSALDNMMERDPDVISFGEDAGYFGGVFRVTANLQTKYGLDRSFDAPINEAAIMGMAIGMAAKGLKPVAEIQFSDYIFPVSTRSSRKCRASAIVPPEPSPRRSWCARPAAVVSAVARPIR